MPRRAENPAAGNGSAPRSRITNFFYFVVDNPFRDDYNVEEMKNALNLGEWEQIVLLAVLRCEDHAYGVAIGEEIRLCTGRESSTGALYTTLDRLEDKGLLRSKLGAPVAERGGRSRRFFTVTSRGKAAVVRAQSAYRRMLEGLDLLKGEL